jgi:hypothetical protein
MKPTRVISTAALFLLFGIATPADGRQEKPQEKAKPEQQQARPEKQQTPAPKQQQQARPEKQQQAKAPQEQQPKPEKQQQAKPQKQQQAQAPKQQQNNSAREQQQAKAQHTPQNNSAKQQQQTKTQQQPHQQQARSSQAPQRTQQAVARQRAQPALRLSARGSGRIPEDRFRSNFGRGHSFRMGNPVLVGGYSRFQYSGFWFGFVEPWPAGWYYTDDVYIDYVDGGYYMYDPYYPGARFSISVVI